MQRRRAVTAALPTMIIPYIQNFFKIFGEIFGPAAGKNKKISEMCKYRAEMFTKPGGYGKIEGNRQFPPGMAGRAPPRGAVRKNGEVQWQKM